MYSVSVVSSSCSRVSARGASNLNRSSTRVSFARDLRRVRVENPAPPANHVPRNQREHDGASAYEPFNFHSAAAPSNSNLPRTTTSTPPAFACRFHIRQIYNGSPTNIRSVRAINIQIRRATFIDQQMRTVSQSAKMPFLVVPPTSTVSQTPFDDRLSLPTILTTLGNPSTTSKHWRSRNKHCRS